ncbi:hypothetical protein E4V99_14165 [Microbacterium sp. dk485]|uniref:hypothetical protein n=1 Tax=Microbacterium TaxID=33882 RepID=UPI001073044E|nr:MULTISPECIES: hypothetical protein [Microbacterium]TFV82073.1 hypothetical protein E4V99_14165 [Microbacterium sp. dk485]TXK20600.1 hypothetical protein FVP99_02980 [Microbacterium wangchenii]
METIDPTPGPGEAAAALDAVAEAQTAVRDRPWPMWLYPINAVLLGGVALAGLVDSSAIGALLIGVLAFCLVAVNYGAGRQVGTPFAIPTSRGFRVLVTAAAAFVVGALLARLADLDWVIIACAVGAASSYAVGAVLHFRSTRG